MGGSKKQTIGYRYYVGLWLTLCRQADALLEIKMAEKRAWIGSLAGGRGSFNKPNLFGGDKREGGASGLFDFLLGESTQPINTYLAPILGELTPAIRGVVSIVFRRPYLVANSARLPKTSFKLLNLTGIHRGWYPEKAPINVEAFGDEASVYIAWNIAYDTTQDQLDGMKEWLSSAVGSIGASKTRLRIERFTLEVTSTSGPIFDGVLDADGLAQALLAIDNQELDDEDVSGECDWMQGLGGLPDFFEAGYDGGLGANFLTNALSLGLPGVLQTLITSESPSDAPRNVVVMLGMRPPTPTSIPLAIAAIAAVPNVQSFAFRVDDPDMEDYDLIDNTPVDGVPMIDTSDPQPNAFLANALLVAWADVNVAHIIRCLWTDPMRGGVVDESEIDDDNFRAAADLFFNEKLGLSPRFRGADAVEADRVDVERHADCISYRSRVNNKIRIKAVRNDYVPEDLPVLDSSIVLDWGNLERALVSEVPNQLTVVYTKRSNGDTASVTRTNIAGVRRAGRVIPGEPVEYLSCTVEELATRFCLRDLSVQHRALLTGPITLAYLPTNLDIGEPFILHEPKLQIYNVVVRITEIDEKDGVDNSIIVTIAEDHWALPTPEATGPGSVPPVRENTAAQPCPEQYVMEAPYYIAAVNLGQETIDEILADEPDTGVMLVSGSKPTAAHRNITVGMDDGSGYVDIGEMDFAPSTQLFADVSADADDTTFTVYTTAALEGVVANSLALIGNEIVRIDSFTANGDFVDITVGRGCLDTVPEVHLTPARLAFLHLIEPIESPTFLSGDTINVKLLTNTTSSRLSLYLAPETALSFNARAIRPYPPGALAINGSFANDQFYADAVVEWAHRDRTVQTTLVPEDFTVGDIGPEAGTTYTIVAEALDEEFSVLSELVNINVGTATTYDWDDAAVLPLGTNRIRFTLSSERDGYECWQRPSINLAVLLSPYNLVAGSIVGGVNLTWDDMNTGVGQEDDVLVYRDIAPFDLSTLPAVLATLAADTETYDDLTAVAATSYYYAVVMRRGTLMSARFTGEIIA